MNKQTGNNNAVGKRKPGPGRPKGSVNKSTAEVKKALTETFTKMGGVAAMVKWAKQEQTEFYKLYAKLLPHQVQAELSNADGTPLAFNVITK